MQGWKLVGSDVGSGVESALERYVDRVASGRRPPDFPRFRGDLPCDASGPGFDFTVDPDVELILRREARGAGGTASPEQLAVHAVLVYLAELDRACVEVIRAPARS